jgi:CheY-like chemotaxis protein
VSKRKLLLADDSITIQKVVNLTFADEGIEVITVSDGNEAIEKIAEFKPDLVMADVNMPGLSGYQICEMIKRDEKTRQIPVILLVGSFEPFDEAEAGRVGANDFLTKPFQSIRQLVNKVTNLLEETTKTDKSKKIPETAEISSTVQTQPETSETPKTQAVLAADISFNDSGMDDEMIETQKVSDFSFPESQRTKVEPENEKDNADTQASSNQEAEDYSFVTYHEAPEEPSEDYKEPTPEENLQESVPETQTKAETVEEQKFETEDLQSFSPGTEITEERTEISYPETTEFSETETEKTVSPETNETFAESSEIKEFSETEVNISTFSEPSPVKFDEDLLELPPLVEETGIRPFTEILETNAQVVQNKQDAAFSQDTSISPEILESIVQKVAEKISIKLRESLLSEIVPQVTDEIIKEISEEN